MTAGLIAIPYLLITLGNSILRNNVFVREKLGNLFI